MNKATERVARVAKRRKKDLAAEHRTILLIFVWTSNVRLATIV